jgi:hypothetical protein
LYNWHKAKEHFDDKLLELGFVPKNVVGRFEDFVTLDIPESKTQKKRVYKTVICLFSRAERNTIGQPSQDTSAKVLRFDTYPEEAVAALRRFPEAWTDYLTYRKASEQPGEAEVLAEVGLTAPVKGPSIVPQVDGKRKRGRPRKIQLDATI